VRASRKLSQSESVAIGTASVGLINDQVQKVQAKKSRWMDSITQWSKLLFLTTSDNTKQTVQAARLAELFVERLTVMAEYRDSLRQEQLWRRRAGPCSERTLLMQSAAKRTRRDRLLRRWEALRFKSSAILKQYVSRYPAEEVKRFLQFTFETHLQHQRHQDGGERDRDFDRMLQEDLGITVDRTSGTVQTIRIPVGHLNQPINPSNPARSVR
jgi:hypothetical protein